MNDASEERVTSAEEPLPPKARVLPFEKPQNALQRAVLVRAQEQVERQRYKPKVAPLRLVVTFCVALVPVILLLGAADVIVRGIHLLVSLHARRAPVEQSAPQQVEQPQVEQQPGVILLVPPRPSDSQASSQKEE
jgi:hypothetical protein